jgi:hypothetical protein
MLSTVGKGKKPLSKAGGTGGKAWSSPPIGVRSESVPQEVFRRLAKSVFSGLVGLTDTAAQGLEKRLEKML